MRNLVAQQKDAGRTERRPKKWKEYSSHNLPINHVPIVLRRDGQRGTRTARQCTHSEIVTKGSELIDMRNTTVEVCIRVKCDIRVRPFCHRSQTLAHFSSLLSYFAKGASQDRGGKLRSTESAPAWLCVYARKFCLNIAPFRQACAVAALRRQQGASSL